MSVRKGDRDEGKLTAINASRLLVEYTYDRVHDKTLPKADRWLMSKSIWDDASLARAKLLRGNAIRVECTEDANERLLLLKEVIGHFGFANRQYRYPKHKENHRRPQSRILDETCDRHAESDKSTPKV